MIDIWLHKAYLHTQALGVPDHSITEVGVKGLIKKTANGIYSVA